MFAFRLRSPQRHTDCLLSLAQEKEHFHRLRVISMRLRGVAAIETTSVPSKKLLLTAPCQRHLAPHPCGDQAWFQAAGLMCAGSSSRPNPIGIGKINSTVLLPFLTKLQACARPFKAATTKDAFTLTSSTGKKASHDWQEGQSQRAKHSRRILLKERPAP